MINEKMQETLNEENQIAYENHISNDQINTLEQENETEIVVKKFNACVGHYQAMAKASSTGASW